MADKPIVAPTPLPDSPPVPQRNNSATFEDRFDAGWEYMFEVLRPGIDDTAENVYENALAAEERAVAADERATDAETAKQAAEDARDKAQDWAEGVEPAPGSKSAKGWAQYGEVAVGDLLSEAEGARDSAWAAAAAAGVEAGLPTPLIPRRVLGVTPAGGVAWVSGSALRRQERTSNSQLGPEHIGHLIDITAGTFTQTFAAASELGEGWWCYIRNSGSGLITLDGPGAVVYPGNMILLQCDGSGFFSILVSGDRVFKAIEEKPSSTPPPSGTASTWNTRAINTVLENQIGASLSDNQIALPAGRYFINASAPAVSAQHKIRLYDATNSSMLINGTSVSMTSGTGNLTVRSYLSGSIVITAPASVKLEHWVAAAASMGAPAGAGVPEVYAEITIWRLP